jgi:phosphohistidine phosphatase SixA
VVESTLPAFTSRRWIRSRINKAFVVSGLLIMTTLTTAFVMWPRSALDLGTAGPHAGEVVLLMRHAERCDRSNHTCLGPTDGITQPGVESAAAVGQGFMRLGMSQTDVFSSPTTRTRQTADALLGKDTVSQEWLRSCGKTLRDEVAAHKVAERNMVLVTHSGCISDFEGQTGFKHATSSEYSSALFVRIDSDGQTKVLGKLNAEDWDSLLSEKMPKQ